ncbi:MAG: aminoglycoside phosphotransferase family protein [Clostridia bacterium]|nr:aminoglycoside phosphotransferase family protein [Clostridia bacterium]
MEMIDYAKQAISHFKIPQDYSSCTPYGNGHINATFCITYPNEKYIMQAINQNAFKHPEQVISNIARVTEFLRAKREDPRSVMKLIETTDGEKLYRDDDNHFWRVYSFVENSLCLDLPESTEDFRQCAIAFGCFQHDLSTFPAEELFETIPDFHNTPKRYEAFLAALEADAFGRAAEVEKEIKFVKDRVDFYSTLFDAHEKGELPLRVTHNDTKSNNVLLDASTRKALCVIDLDTIMPGFSVNDFGDSIRSGANTAAEDERDLSKVHFNLELFKAYADGFLQGCEGGLTSSEIMLLPEGAKMMTIECGMRFLTDYLSGDTYFRTSRPGQNLDRCRTQFKLVEEMEAAWDDMKESVKKYL